MTRHVKISSRAVKEMQNLPVHVGRKLQIWVNDVKERGVEAVRKTPGYHDEALKGKRAGQRSIRLNRSYRAIYVINKERNPEFIQIEEVNKHAY